MTTIFSVLITVLVSLPLFAFDHSHAGFNQVLSKFVVTSGQTTKVKYFELIKEQTLLHQYISSVEAVTKAEYQSFSESQKLAFLFNSYNALTMKLIVDELQKDKDLKSIKKIGGLFGNPWKIKFFKFLEKQSFLDEIEQEIARKNFDEPRMHFAFNCASIGCPSLQKVAFVPEKLDAQLDQATKMFFSDNSRNIFEKKNQSLQLSSILKWYKDDFEKSKKLGPLRNFLLIYFPFTPEEKKMFESGKVDIKYLDYDWNLNKI
jgi:Protein of unknown function, DUF547